MSDINVVSFIQQLRQYLPLVPPIHARELRALHRAQDYEGMVRLIRRAMNLDVRLVIGWVNSGGPNQVPAWVQVPSNIPYYGSEAFKKLSIKMFIRKDFLQRTGYDQAAIAIAHELSHIVLESIHHPLRNEEKAVDLAAMLLGFSQLYMTAAHTSTSRLGYLTPTELDIAARLLVPTRQRIRRTALLLVQQFAPLLLLMGIVTSIWIQEQTNTKTWLRLKNGVTESLSRHSPF